MEWTVVFSLSLEWAQWSRKNFAWSSYVHSKMSEEHSQKVRQLKNHSVNSLCYKFTSLKSQHFHRLPPPPPPCGFVYLDLNFANVRESMTIIQVWSLQALCLLCDKHHEDNINRDSQSKVVQKPSPGLGNLNRQIALIVWTVAKWVNCHIWCHNSGPNFKAVCTRRYQSALLLQSSNLNSPPPVSRQLRPFNRMAVSATRLWSILSLWIIDLHSSR